MASRLRPPLSENLIRREPVQDLTSRRDHPAGRAAIVAAVIAGRLSLEEAGDRYAMSLEEFAVWDRAFRNSGDFLLEPSSPNARTRRRARRVQ